jgi:gliding motility-associated-like protein
MGVRVLGDHERHDPALAHRFSAWLTIDVPDTIIAHFVPPVSHDVVVLTDPPNSAQVQLGGTLISTFPHVESVPEGISMPLKVFPNLYFDFLYWEVKNNDIVPADSTLEAVDITFFSSDTIIAHLDPEEFGFFVPNSFTPNGDGINDVWSPLGNAMLPQTYELHIWDRWGEEIFSSKDPAEGWDGTAGGKEVPIGVYVFHTNVVDAISLEKLEYYGHVTIVR